MNSKIPYTSTKIILVMEFNIFYPEVEIYTTIESLLESVPRKSIIRIAQLLENIYKELGFENIQKFFSPESSMLRNDFNERIRKYSKEDATCSFAASKKVVELLRYAFSVQYVQNNFEVLYKEYNSRLN